MHWACYAAWPERHRFARGYVDGDARGDEGNVFWAPVRRDELVYVSRSLAHDDIRVRIAATAAGYRVPAEDWEGWLAPEHPEEASFHPVEHATLAKVRAHLRAVLPTLAAVEAAVDPKRRRAFEAYQEEQRRAHEAERRHEAGVREQAARAEAEGLACPQCRDVRRDYKVSNRQRRRLYLQCRRCGHRFGPEGPVSE
jgi:hypothetical protein